MVKAAIFAAAGFGLIFAINKWVYDIPSFQGGK